MHGRLNQLLEQHLASSALRGGCLDYNPTSRIHRLRPWTQNVWLKREDELSASISGCKWRKLLGLSSGWSQQGIDTLVAFGGSRSQFLLGLMQIARELGLELHLLVKEGSPLKPQGTDLLWPLLVQSYPWEAVARPEWPKVEAKAIELKRSLQSQDRRVFLVREGGAQWEGLLGALSLPLDIQRQEEQLGRQFSYILVDAGTGLTAQALILGLGCLGHPAQVHVVLCAGDEQSFARDLADFHKELAQHLPGADQITLNYLCHVPRSARSFGSTNRAVFAEISRTAAESGVLLDPVYSAKMFMVGRELVASFGDRADILFIHSGGSQSLFGFPEQIQSITVPKT